MNIIKEQNPISRKEHICSWCGGIISKKERYKRVTIENNGDLYDWKSHENCETLTYELNMWENEDGEGLDGDDFNNHIEEFLNTKQMNSEDMSTYRKTLLIKEILLDEKERC